MSTLSNQQLMGRLVYVREVSLPNRGRATANSSRTVNRSHDLLPRAACEAATAALAATLVAPASAVPAAAHLPAASFTSQTFVPCPSSLL